MKPNNKELRELKNNIAKIDLAFKIGSAIIFDGKELSVFDMVLFRDKLKTELDRLTEGKEKK